MPSPTCPSKDSHQTVPNCYPTLPLNLTQTSDVQLSLCILFNLFKLKKQNTKTLHPFLPHPTPASSNDQPILGAWWRISNLAGPPNSHKTELLGVKDFVLPFCKS